MSEPRGYGADSSEDFDVIAEATMLDDGTVHYELVIIDKRDGASPSRDKTP